MTGLGRDYTITLIKEIRIALCELLRERGYHGCEWTFSSEQDLQACLYHLAYNASSEHIASRNVWLGVEAQPRWFLHDLGNEFFRTFGFTESIDEVRHTIEKALKVADYSGKRSPRFDLALLARTGNSRPHLHIWETKFFSLSLTPMNTLRSCLRDARRVATFKGALEPIMRISGEVIWVDPYSTCKDSTWSEIGRQIKNWNQLCRTVPIRLWAYSKTGTLLRVGF